MSTAAAVQLENDPLPPLAMSSVASEASTSDTECEPEDIAIGQRQGPLGDKSQCGTCGMYAVGSSLGFCEELIDSRYRQILADIDG
jgi:hypothetical protein